MATNREVITHALRMIGVLDANESAQIEDATLALTEMNDLFANLSADNIDLGYPPQENLSEDFPLDDTTQAQIKPLLAMALLVHYPSARPVDTLPVRATGALTALRRVSALEAMEEPSVTHAPLGERHGALYDVIADE